MRCPAYPFASRLRPLTLLGALLLTTGTTAHADRDRREALKFAAEMAQKGNWREARFRWERAAAQEPDNGRVLNNLAVALEALGETSEALAQYEKALALSGGNPQIADNAARAARFWKGAGDPAPSHEPIDAVRPEPAARGRVKGGDAFKVNVELPLPARMDVSSAKTLLVASFLSRESDLLETGREIARFLRIEFRKRSSLEVLEVTPPPAVPEQTLEDLARNREFWQQLGREHGADLIVSGQIRYDRRDASGFQEVEEISQITGQKVRATRFVEQEQFTYEIDLLFLDGQTGELRFRDRLERSALYRGQANDPITAFYQLSEAIAGDVLAVVSPRTREDSRVLFRS